MKKKKYYELLSWQNSILNFFSYFHQEDIICQSHV